MMIPLAGGRPRLAPAQPTSPVCELRMASRHGFLLEQNRQEAERVSQPRRSKRHRDPRADEFPMRAMLCLCIA